MFFFFFSSRRRHTRSLRDWSSDVCSSDLEDPLGELGHFYLAAREVAGVESLHQIDAGEGGVLRESWGSVRCGRWGKRDRRSRSEQAMQPVLVEQHLQMRRLPQRANFFLLAPGGKRLLLHRQGNELFEALGFGVAQAPLPLGHRAPGDAQQLTQSRLAQADRGAQLLDEETKGIVSLLVRVSLHERSPFCVTRRS